MKETRFLKKAANKLSFFEVKDIRRTRTNILSDLNETQCKDLLNPLGIN